jgi:hypothetical protein
VHTPATVVAAEVRPRTHTTCAERLAAVAAVVAMCSTPDAVCMHGHVGRRPDARWRTGVARTAARRARKRTASVRCGVRLTGLVFQSWFSQCDDIGGPRGWPNGRALAQDEAHT